MQEVPELDPTMPTDPTEPSEPTEPTPTEPTPDLLPDPEPIRNPNPGGGNKAPA